MMNPQVNPPDQSSPNAPGAHHPAPEATPQTPGVEALRGVQAFRDQCKANELRLREDTLRSFRTFLMDLQSKYPTWYGLVALGTGRTDSLVDHGLAVEEALRLLHPWDIANRPSVNPPRGGTMIPPNGLQQMHDIHQWLFRLAVLPDLRFAFAWRFDGSAIVHAHCHGMTWDCFVNIMVNSMVH